MPKINVGWHERNPMPRSATIAQLVTWHAAHEKACACGDISAAVVRELKPRGTPEKNWPAPLKKPALRA